MSGDLALVADWDKGLRVIDVSEPSLPVEVGFLDTPGFARDVAVSGGLAVVADYDAGLRVIDISEPSAPGWRWASWGPLGSPTVWLYLET